MENYARVDSQKLQQFMAEVFVGLSMPQEGAVDKLRRAAQRFGLELPEGLA